jgi:hypothetical protein
MSQETVTDVGAFTQDSLDKISSNFDELYGGNAFVGGTIDNNTTMASGKTFAVTTADKLTVAGVIVSPTKSISVQCPANADCVDKAFFIADRAYQVTAIGEVHSAAGTNGSAVNLQVTKDVTTDAPGAGTDLLTNNTNAGFDLKGTANTVQAGTLTATTASLQLAAGDRLSLDFAGTLTTLAGVLVTVTLKPI